jgi:hypothetical protein
MPRVSAKLFVNKADTNFSAVFKKDDLEIEKKVKRIFDADRLNHEMSKAYDVDASFDVYWKIYKQFWHSIDLNVDGKNELVFSTYQKKIEANELFEIYTLDNGEYKSIYQESGHILCFKIQPNTKEIVLFHHKYPCCSSGSHNINMIRLINGKIVLRKKYFVGFDVNVQGDFFPKKSNYSAKYHYLNEVKKLRWSNLAVTKNASAFSQNNIVAEFDVKTPYKVLFKSKKWTYVVMYGVPLKKREGVGFLNFENFKDVHVYGWIYNKEEL